VSEKNGLKHQPAIDGVRAVAVLAVVLYHSGVSWVSGGFLGVDGFFVVSGFLITTLMVDEFAVTHRIDLRSFWLRRIRRLLPALLFLLFAVASWALLVEPEWAASLSGDLVAALTYVSNWRFIIGDRSYFEVFGSPSPLRHTWSLAIEEQWYIVWPLVVAGALWLTFRLLGRVADSNQSTSGSQLRRALPALAIGSVALAMFSAGWMAWLADADSDVSRLYYGTDTRAQGLLVGCALGFAGWGRLGAVATLGRGQRRVISVIGIGSAGVVASTLFLAVDVDGWLYEGGFLLVALAWAGVIAAATNGIPGPIGWVLGSAPFVAVGRLSYGIYLWHWPVQLIITPDRLGGSLATLTATRLIVTVALAGISLVMIENPVRDGRLLPTPRLTLTAAGVASIAVLGISLLLRVEPDDRLQQAQPPRAESAQVDRPSSTDVPPGGASPTSVAPSENRPDDQLQRQAPASDIAPDTVQPPSEPIEVVVLGDSVAFNLAYYSGTIEEINLENRAQMGCGVVPNELWVGNRRIRRADACARWTEDWASVDQGDIAVAFIGSWDVFDPHVNGKRLEVGTQEWEELFTARLQEGVDSVAAAGAQLGLASVPCYDTAGMVGEIPSAERDDPTRVAAVNKVIRAVTEANADTVSVIDWAGFACPNGTSRTEVDGRELRPDGIHTDANSTPLVWTWLIGEIRNIEALGA